MTPEDRAARERKQKIFVVVGGLFLVALLAFQLPKLLGGSSSAEATPTTTSTTSDVGAAATPPTTPAPVSAQVDVVSIEPAVSTKLDSLSLFAAKDPFVQQVAPPKSSETPGSSSDPESGSGKNGESGKGGSGGTTAPQEFTPGTSSGSAVTIITVNGVRQVLSAGQTFPSSDPSFVLVEEKPGAKSVVLGVSGGTFASGAKTATLKAGKTMTLVNTATGARYKLKLVSVGSGGETEPATGR